MSEILNVAAYKFVPLDQLAERRETLRDACQTHGLKGTILLSPEGINMFLAGSVEPLRAWIAWLREDPAFQDLVVKESFSDSIPFNRMLVKLKREIIAFGIDGIAPHQVTSPKLEPRELKRWLDEQRDLVLLDVRNDFEVEVGTFENAVPAGVDHFRQFEEAVDRLPEDYRSRPIVMFCTGGIRCEKAGPLMERKGFSQVYQLDGGILRYFEEVGGDHYRGECFVFDDRVSLDPALNVSGKHLCYVCQAVLTPTDVRSDRYVYGESCPHCYRTPAERMRETLSDRIAKLREVTDPLPGCVPHEQRRPLRIPERCDGMTLIDAVCDLFPQIERATWQDAIEQQRILEGTLAVRAGRRVRSGEQFVHCVPEFIEPPVNADVRFLWEDDALVVVDKPAPLPVHASGRFRHNTLLGLLNQVYAPEVLRAAHRLDANTSGVMVLCRRRVIARDVQRQFEQQEVTKQYRLRCVGQPEWDQFRCELPIAERPGEGRIRVVDAAGVPAVTEFEAVTRHADGTSEMVARPITGRTNQIRVHLWALGMPIVGDPLYLPERQLGQNRTLDVDETSMELRAESIRLTHPISGEPLVFCVDDTWQSSADDASEAEPTSDSASKL